MKPTSGFQQQHRASPPHGMVIDLAPHPDLGTWQPPEPARINRRQSATTRMLTSRAAAWAQVLVERLRGPVRDGTDKIAAGARAALREVVWHAIERPAPYVGRMAGRFLRGELMSGQPRTDCTFWRPGKRQLRGVDGKSAPWSFLAGVQRLAVRVAMLSSACAGARALAPTTSALILGLAAVVGLVWTVWGARDWTVRRHHRRIYLQPLHDALKEHLRPPAHRPEEWLGIPPDFRSRSDELFRIDLPAYFGGNPALEATIARVVTAKLGLTQNAYPSYDTEGAHPSLVFRNRASCPAIVRFSDCLDELERCRPGEIFIGRTGSNSAYFGSFLTDDPHWGFEVGSRRGKSTFLSITAAQILHQDRRATCTGIDVKRESFRPLFGVPRFNLYNDPRDIIAMWNGIAAFRAEMDRRCDVRAHDPTVEFPFNLLLIDEVTQFSAQSKHLWAKMRTRNDPAHPPVWDDIAAVMWQGAAYHCHVLLAGQRLDHMTTGGIGLIGSMGFRGLAGFRPQNYQRLIGTRPVPRSRSERGRWIYSDGNTETWVQNVWGSDEEINNYARAPRDTQRPASADPAQDPRQPADLSRVSRPHPIHPGQTPDSGARATHVTGVTSVTTPPAPAPGPPAPTQRHAGPSRWSEPARSPGVSLKEACELGIVPHMKPDALRQWRRRDPDFPPVSGRRGHEKLHDPQLLATWAKHRFPVD